MQPSDKYRLEAVGSALELPGTASGLAAAPARSHDTLAYRPDIDGLRALAVLPVLFFHANVAGFGGGYVGVDVFFVISGYLITSIVWRDLELERFSIVKFYERRVRRLLPALFAVLIATTALAAWLLMPLKFREFGKSMIAVAGFATNILFFRDTGYFDAPAEMKPLLHTWSLAVEEQFYLFFPLILLMLHRWRAGWGPLWTIVVLAAASFAANVVMTPAHQSATFYLLPFRAWELMLGAFLAVAALPAPRTSAAAGLGLAGIAAILLAVFAYTSATPFPGWAAALPCLGAALIIYSGQARGGAAYRVLSQPVLTFVGKISYSLYLWHWPIVVFAKYFTTDGHIDAVAALWIVALSLAAAVLSYRFVETPFRDAARFSRRAMFVGAAGATALWLAIGAAAYGTNGMPARLADHVKPFAAAAEDFLPGPRVCDTLSAEFGERVCLIGARGRTPTFLLWGDSHAGMVVHGIDDTLAQRNLGGLYAGLGGCPPLLGVAKDESNLDAATDARCTGHNQAIIELLERSPEIQTVLLVSRWAYYAAGTGYGPEATNRVKLWELGANPETAQNRAAFQAGFDRTMQALTALGKRVFVLEQVPELDGYSAERIANKLARSGEAALRDAAPVLTLSRERVEQRQRAFAEAARAWEARGVTTLRTHDVFCDRETCRAMLDGVPMYFDNNHITMRASRVLRSVYAPMFEP